MASHALGLPTCSLTSIPPAPVSPPSSKSLQASASSPLVPHPSPASNPLIIFPFTSPHPPRGSICSVGPHTRVYVLAHLHARVPLTAGGLPGASGPGSLHKTPTQCPSLAPGQALLSLRQGGRRENKSPIPTRPLFRGLSESRATKGGYRSKHFEIPVFPRPSESHLRPSSRATGKFSLKSELHPACCSGGQAGQPQPQDSKVSSCPHRTTSTSHLPLPP